MSMWMEQDYLLEPLYSDGTKTRSIYARSPSSTSNATLRELMQSWAGPSSTPPGCRTVSFSKWTRFTTSVADTLPAGKLKASILCKDRGTSASYDPPADEWTYLGVDQPANPAGSARMQRRKQQWQDNSATWSRPSGTDAVSSPTMALQFGRQQLKWANITSQLTALMKASYSEDSRANAQGSSIRILRLAFEGITCEDLPSAFDSDSEEGDEELAQC